MGKQGVLHDQNGGRGGGPGNSPSLVRAKPVENYEVSWGTVTIYVIGLSPWTHQSNRLPSWYLATPLLLLSSQLLTCLRSHVLAPQEGTELVVVIMGCWLDCGEQP